MQRIKKKQLKQILLTAAFLLVSILVLGVVGYTAWLNHIDFEKAMIRQTMSQLSLITESEAQSVEQYITNIAKELQLMSTSFAVRKVVKEQPTVLREDLKYYASLKDSYRDIENLVDSFYLIDKQGTAWNMFSPDSTNQFQDFSHFSDVATVLKNQEAFVSSVFKDGDGHQVLSLVQPVFDNQEFLGGLRTLISIERLNSLFKHINNENRYYALLMDNNTTVLSSQEKQYIGTNISKFLSENLVKQNPQMVSEIIQKINRGEKGSFIDTFYIKAGEKAKARFLVTFAPIHVGSKNWCLFVGLNYNIIAAPINKNLRDNVISAIALMIIFSFLGIGFYITKQQSIKFEIAQITSDIITKQLHMEIAQRKELEKELKEKLKLKNLPESQA
ncbi:MAG: cache domain-containing protein [Candidatus Omnitrophica bacterium]|nr:cache domain-containing protein [Candidatus Omnitrophota bacterium]MDD5610322.1 cache domain-containing protein [Candidatus Omnitrophota bacterium]